MVSWVSADSSKYILGMFPFLCRSMSDRRSSITSSCRGGKGRRRRDRGRRSIWPAGKGNGMTARATPLGITTTIKVTAANRGRGVEGVGAGVEGRTNLRDPALCWPTITWWSWNRSSRCRVSSPRVVPALLSHPPAVSQSCPGSWASNSSSHLKIRRKVLRRLRLLPQPLTPQQQHHHHLHHQVAALRSVLSHPAKPSTLGSCLTLGNLRGGHVWMGLRCPELGKDRHHRHRKDNLPGLTWTAFRTRSPRLEEKVPRTGIQQTWTQPVPKSSSSTENSSLVTSQLKKWCVYCGERPDLPSVLSQAMCRSTWSRVRRRWNWWEMAVALVCFFCWETKKQALKERRKPLYDITE